MCKDCGDERRLAIPPGSEGVSLPRSCSAAGRDDSGNPNPLGAAKCRVDPFQILPDKCVYVDQQRLKPQEAPETVPTGEMPRTVEVSVDRVYADRIAPGTRIRLLAIASISKASDGRAGRVNAVAVRVPYL